MTTMIRYLIMLLVLQLQQHSCWKKKNNNNNAAAVVVVAASDIPTKTDEATTTLTASYFTSILKSKLSILASSSSSSFTNSIATNNNNSSNSSNSNINNAPYRPNHRRRRTGLTSTTAATNGSRSRIRNNIASSSLPPQFEEEQKEEEQKQRYIVLFDPDRVQNVTHKIRQLLSVWVNRITLDEMVVVVGCNTTRTTTVYKNDNKNQTNRTPNTIGTTRMVVTIPYIYDTIVLKGFVIENLPLPNIIHDLQTTSHNNDPDILYIQEDVTMSYDDIKATTTIPKKSGTTTTRVPYYLDRLDGNQSVPYDGIYHTILTTTPYQQQRYNTNSSSTTTTTTTTNHTTKLPSPPPPPSVTIYIMDSGIRMKHIEFHPSKKTRSTTTTYVSCGLDAVLGYESDIPCDDLHGHGTHIASVIGGSTLGVLSSSSSSSSSISEGSQLCNNKTSSTTTTATANSTSNKPTNNRVVHIKSVKVALQDLTFQGGAVLYGLQYILLEKLKHLHQPMIINMSFGGPKFILLDYMVEALLSINVTIIAAAGNDGMNRCSITSPGGNRGVITVGTSNRNDIVPYWSNYGNCVDLYAPGVNIIGASHRDDTEYRVRTGTSYSTPIVTGVAAMYLLLQPSLTPSQIVRLLVLDSLKNVLQFEQQQRIMSSPIRPPRPAPIVLPISSSPRTTPTTTTSTNNATKHNTTNTASNSYWNRMFKNRLVHTGIFSCNNRPIRKYPTCPYTTKRKMHLCYEEGWLK